MYRTTDDFKDVLESNAELFFVDIEETLLAPNLYYKNLGLPEYNKEFIKLCNEMEANVDDVLYHGKNFKRSLLQPETKFIIDKLQMEGKKVFAFTSGYPSKKKRSKIRELHVYFNGYLFAKGLDKGPFLVNFLKRNTNLTGNCLFIDNDEQKIVNVYYNFYDNFQDRNIDLVLYNRKVGYTITLNHFKKYWKSVIKTVNREKELLNLDEDL